MAALGLPLPLFLPACGLVLVLALALRAWGMSSRLPPGPNPIPILGNTGFPKNYRAAHKRWADEYGDLMLFRLLSVPIVMVNSRRAAFELLKKRATGTWERPPQVMADELVGMGPDPARTNDYALHKQYRKLYSIALGSRGASIYWPAQIQQARQATLRMLSSPKDYKAAIHRATAAIAFLVAWGYELEGDQDDALRRVKEGFRMFEQTLIPGNFIVDALPLLKYLPDWIPGAGFKQTAKAWNAHLTETREMLFERVKQDMAAGTARESLAAISFEEKQDGKEGFHYDEDLIKWVTFAVYNGGHDTSACAIHNFLAAMALWPVAQAKAQKELDAVIGRERLPTMEDRDSLPYCSAIVQEVLRWQPVNPFALAHVLTTELEFEGHVLPKGTTLLPNVWAMTRDERDYPSAEEFRPERFLTADGKELLANYPARNLSLTFGFGRRVCPGTLVGEANLFAAIVSILWSCNVTSRSSDIEWPDRMGLHQPAEFPLELVPRFLTALDTLRSSVVSQ